MVGQGFPGGAVVESPPADAGDTDSCPGPGRPHMPRSSWAREPWPLSLRVRSLCSATGETTAVRGPHTAKKKKIYFWLCWVFVAACRLSLVAMSGLLIAVASLVAEHRL